MNRKTERMMWLTIIIILFLVIFYLSMTPGNAASTVSSNSLLKQLQTVIEENYYIEPPSVDELYVGAAKGMVSSLGDPFSAYATKKELEDRRNSLSHSFGGIGAYIGIEENIPTIIRLIPDSPAKKSGILPGDMILEVDGKTTEGLDLDTVTSLIKGEPGTLVNIKIKRYNSKEPFIISIKREIIRVQVVKSGKLTDKIYYIKISDFGDDTASNVKNILTDGAIGYKSLIIDLRGNPGGYLDEAINLLQYFFTDKMLVYTKGRNKQFNETYYAKNNQFVSDNVKIVVLVDENSASAAEIFTAVMKDYNRATIVGQKTFGKGVVQQIFPFKDGSALFLTISQYFSPNGYVIQGKGIEPDINVKPYQYSDDELATIAILQKKGVLYQFIQKYGANNTDILFNKIKQYMKTQKLQLSDQSLRYLIYQLSEYYGEEVLFNLEFDYMLQKAIDVLNEKNSQ